MLGAIYGLGNDSLAAAYLLLWHWVDKNPAAPSRIAFDTLSAGLASNTVHRTRTSVQTTRTHVQVSRTNVQTLINFLDFLQNS